MRFWGLFLFDLYHTTSFERKVALGSPGGSQGALKSISEAYPSPGPGRNGEYGHKGQVSRSQTGRPSIAYPQQS